tara:strand:- start:106861 stop:107037 length:177 start_codon:yes stop_codon:yes gene_type:complete
LCLITFRYLIAFRQVEAKRFRLLTRSGTAAVNSQQAGQAATKTHPEVGTIDQEQAPES